MKRILIAAFSMFVLSVSAYAGPSLRVLDYGAEPRAPIRYQFKVGKAEHSTMEMAMSMSMEMDGKAMPMPAMPAVRASATTRVTEVSADGSARLEFDTHSAEMEVGGASGALDARAVSNLLGGLSQLKGWYRVDPLGRMMDADVTLPESLLQGLSAEAVRQMMDDLVDQQSNALQQFPEEALGVGARWEVVGDLKLGPLAVRTTEEFTLRSRSGTRVELGMRATQQMLPDASVAAAGASLQAGGPGSSGTMVIDLEGSMPEFSMVAEQSTEVTVPAQAGAEPRTMKSRSQMRMTLAPAAE